MDEIDLKRLQNTALSILNFFDMYCQAHALKYFLIGGALLGATRYNRFIPWDDDIDVAMFREDYDKLQMIWEKEPIQDYFLQSSKSDPLFARGILKLRLNDTEIIEKCCRNVKIHNGIYIDIFPIDYIDEIKESRIDCRAKMIRALLSLLSIKCGYDNGRYHIIKRILKMIIPLSKKNINKKIHDLCTLENNGTKKYAIIFVHNYNWHKQIHDIEIFGNGRLCSFEGCSFISPTDTNAFLTKVFGENYLDEPENKMKKQPHQYLSVKFKNEDII